MQIALEQVETKDGLLSMRPIAEAWIPAATELLTDAFAEAMGYRPAFRCVRHVIQPAFTGDLWMRIKL